MTAHPEHMLDNVTRGDCVEVMKDMRSGSVDLILTDPPYLVNYRDRSGRQVKNDDNADWLDPAFSEMHRVLKDGGACLSFYAWNRIDLFMAAWKKAGFRVVGHVVFPKKYASGAGFTEYRHEQAYLLTKGAAAPPAARRHPVELYRQPPAPHPEAGRHFQPDHRGFHETGRHGLRPLLRFRFYPGRSARSGLPLYRHRTGRSPPRHSLLAPQGRSGRSLRQTLFSCDRLQSPRARRLPRRP